MLCTLVHGPTMATPNYDIKEIPIPMLSSVLFNLEIYLSACYLDWMVSPLYKKDSLRGIKQARIRRITLISSLQGKSPSSTSL